MPNLKAVAAIVAAVTLALVVTFFYGRSQASVDQFELETTRLRLRLVEARAQVLDARISLYLVNFGDAGRHLTYAKNALGPAREGLVSRRETALVATLDQASKEVVAAQELSARLSQDANDRAGEGARLLNNVIQAITAR